MSIPDKLLMLPVGSVKLQGRLGKALRLTLENRLKKVDYDKLVASFRNHDDTDGGANSGARSFALLSGFCRRLLTKNFRQLSAKQLKLWGNVLIRTVPFPLIPKICAAGTGMCGAVNMLFWGWHAITG